MSAKVLVDDTPNARAELRPMRRTCTHPGCTARALYKSDFDEDLCGPHFRALRAESEARPALQPAPVTTSGAIMNDCLIDDCNEPGKARGLCPRHYQGGLRQTARERGIRKDALDPASIEDAELVAAAKRCIARIAGETTAILVATTEPATNVLPVLTLVDALATMPKDCDDPYAVEDTSGVATTEPDVAVAIARDEKEDREQAEWAERLVQVRALASKEPPPAVTLVLTADELERRHAALVNAKILRGSKMEILGLPSFAQAPVQAAAMAVLDAQLAYWEGIAFLGDPS